MATDKEKIKKKAQKVLDNQGSVQLSQLETEMEAVEKLDAVIQAIKEIPRVEFPDPIPFPEHPKHPEEIKISNFPDIQKVEVTNFPKFPEPKAPIVNIQPPEVNVKASDVFVDTESIVEGIKNIKFPEGFKLIDKEGEYWDYNELKEALKSIKDTNKVIAMGGGGSGNLKINDQPVSTGNPVPVSGSFSLDASDIEIGAVELKDGTTDNRASISAAGAVKVDGSAVTQPVSGTVTPQRTATEVTFSTTTVQAVGTTDASGYVEVSVQITSQGTSSTVVFQGSNDNTNWSNTPLLISNAIAATAPVISTTAVNSYHGPIKFKYFRLNVTGISAGTTAGIIQFFTQASQPMGSAVGVTSVVPGTSSGALGKSVDGAAGATDTGVLALGVRDDALTTLTPIDGDYTQQRVNARGAQWVAVEDGAGGQITTFPVSATNLDIRDLVFATDKVDASGSSVALDSTTLTALELIGIKGANGTNIASNSNPLPISDAGGSLTIDGTVTAVGAAADAAAVSGNPVLIAGKEEATGFARTLRTDADGELIVHQKSASHAQADGVSNTRQVAAATDETALIINEVYPYNFNGTTWDRLRGTATDGLLVNLGANNDVTVAGVSTAANQTTIIGHLDGVEGLLTTIDGDTGTIAGAVSGSEMQVDVVAALPAGTNLLGATTPGASATVGTGTSHFRDPAVTNTAVAIKASAGKLHGYNLYNPNSSLAYVHFYNVAAASVTVGTTTPLRSIALPSTANGTIALDRSDPLGIAFSTAISVAASTTATGGTAPGTALVVNAEYI